MQLKTCRVDWEYASIFRIAYRTRTHSQTVVAELEDAGHSGRGEALGVYYNGETIDALMDQLACVASDVRNGASRADVQRLLPAGGARNALDCAYWDFEAKVLGRRVWELVGLTAVRPLQTAYTLGVDTPAAMSRAATSASRCGLLKVKLNGDASDVARVAAVRSARPDAQLVVDANQAWRESQLYELAPHLATLGVTLIEQPLPKGKDEALARFTSPVPLCADESFQTSASLPDVLGKYHFVNIKLDKTGGLTEALHAARAALAAGLSVMVGCMGGSSLSMAPGFVVGQLCDLVDLDGPLLLKADVPDAIRYEGNCMSLPEARLWG